MTRRRWGLLVVALAALITAAAVGYGLYAGVANRNGLLPGGSAVALIRFDGTITDETVAPTRGGRQNIKDLLTQAERDSSVKAVVLRINSLGGSAAAAQELYDQVGRLRQSGKPVVAYLTDTAASGGYYVAAAADRIVSQPATITGSIGVIITSLDTQGLQDKIGVRQRVIKSDPYKDILNKDILSANRDLTPEEQAILNTLVQQTLDQFVSAVAKGRNLPEAQVRQIADGRVVTGTEAQRLHLVDEVGDQERAVELAAQLAKLPPKPRVVVYEPSSAGGLLGLLGSLSDNLSGKAVLDQLGSGGVRYEWRGE
jgi:protease-4